MDKTYTEIFTKEDNRLQIQQNKIIKRFSTSLDIRLEIQIKIIISC